MSDRTNFRAGDTVKHGPSDETWVLACDEENDEVSPCGWPESFAKATDCELVESASDEDRLKMLQDWADKKGSDDHRIRAARYQLSSDALATA